MKKSVLLFATAALLLPALLPAQALHHRAPAPPANALVQAILSAQVAGGQGGTTAQKGTQLKQRLVTFVYRGANAANSIYGVDSVRFFYTGLNGSGGLLNATWDDYSNAGYIQAAYGKPKVMADSVVFFEKFGSAVPVVTPPLINSTYYTYDGAGNILGSLRTYPNSASTASFVNTYWSTGKIKTSVNNGSTFTSYNTDGNPLRDSFANINNIPTVHSYVTNHYYTGLNADSVVTTFAVSVPVSAGNVIYNRKRSRTLNTFNGIGLMTASVSINTDSLGIVKDTAVTQQNSYDAQGRLTTAITTYGGSAGQGSSKVVYGYTGVSPVVADYRNYTLVGSGYQLAYRSGYHINSAGIEDTAYFYNVNNGQDTLFEKDPFVYNAGGFLSKVYSMPYNIATNTYGTAFDSSVYTYETYNDPTAVAPFPAALAPAMLACPNPVRDALRITATGAWSISDISGRVLANGNMPASVDVRDWPAGMYLLRGTGGVQRLLKE